jgi:hypothetical protein
MLSNLNIPKELRRKIDNELQPGELIRWVEQPIPRFFTASSIGSVLLGIPWTSLPIFQMWVMLGFGSPDRLIVDLNLLFALFFDVLFALSGFAMLYSPIWEWQVAKKTVYLVTDKRAISIQGGRSTIIKSYFPDRLKDLYQKERADGTGDVIIKIQRWNGSDGDEVVFLGVRSPREVENILRQLVRNNV